MKLAELALVTLTFICGSPTQSFANDLGNSLKDNGAESHICDLTFLDQTLEPNPAIIRNTLHKILTQDFDILYNQRFMRILVGQTYNTFSGVPQSGLIVDSRYVKGEIRIWKNIRQAYKLIGSSDLNKLWVFLKKAKETQGFYQTQFDGIAPRVWSDFTGSVANLNPFELEALYPVPRQHHKAFMMVMGQIIANPKLQAFVIEEINAMVNQLEIIGPEISPKGKISSHALASLKAAHARIPTLEAPLTTRMNTETGAPLAPPRSERFDFTALTQALSSADESIAEATLQLNNFYLTEREFFTSDPSWGQLFQRGQIYLKTLGANSADRLAMIRSTTDAAVLVDQYLKALSAAQNLVSVGKQTLDAQMATTVDEFERQTLASQLKRILILQATIQTNIVNTLKAQAILESLNGFYSHSKLDKNQNRELQNLLLEVVTNLGLDSALKDYLVKKSWF